MYNRIRDNIREAVNSYLYFQWHLHFSLDVQLLHQSRVTDKTDPTVQTKLQGEFKTLQDC